ncbi:non-specific phospholipase C2 isoform X2 [Arachis ipaensis]|uniref:non-specific phospholipase C2 isoform X2 n=1 Tax=Arachis ipaensis TaxID=130454 RepID=UPI000A2B6B3A|nr:non-specific phospholipase C2 isoform X2 [Arachis ipaensis]XP_025645232.1 non-specific phospholipase C2 isoform X2 [Arachis hypogaea]QHO05536.1 Non-specific phospholipase [Arachis hypogaea]
MKKPQRRTTGTKSKRSILSTLALLLLITSCPFKSVDAVANPIKTVVVLVMENRSFDHMLGWMKKLNPEINGVNGSESNPLSVTDPNSKRFFFKEEAQYVDPDPGHSFQAIREQIFGSNDTSADPAPMNGFAQQAYSMDNTSAMSNDVMNGFDPDNVAVYKSLVSEFAVFDRWFSSVPASTQPNRLYVHSATSHGATSNVASLLAKGYPQQTIFDNLNDAGIDFGIYYQNIPATLFYKNLRKLKYIFKFHPYDLWFKQHAKEGKLPGYVVVEQRYMDTKLFPANDDHPSHDVYQGQMFVKEVYETLRASPQWNQTLLVITYDEHGGFFDHVPTPVRGVPSPDGIVGPEPFNFTFDRLGVRVPTIAVSPWIQKGTEKLPTPVKMRQGEAKEDGKMSEFQQELIQLAAVIKGENILTSYPDRVGKKMTVKQGKDYMEKAVRRFFEAGRYAKKMGVSDDHIVQMKPSLTTRSSKPTNTNP